MNDGSKLRESIYALVAPIGALLVFYGIITEDEVRLWSVLVGVILTSGMNVVAAVMVHLQRKGREDESSADASGPRHLDR